jgi:hypothetical protein
MALVREFLADRSKQVRRQQDGTGKTGCGDDRHMLVGSSGTGGNEYRYRSLARFNHNWTGVRRVVKAELAIKTQDDATNHFGFGSKPKVRAERLTASFSDGSNGENVWTSGEYEWPANTGGVEKECPINPSTGLPQDEAWVYIDITAMIKPVVPKGVLMPDGTAGGGGTNYGFLLRTPGDELTNSQRAIFHSHHATDSANRPRIRLTYDPVNQAPLAPTLTAPATTNVAFGDSFEGTHSDPESDPMAARDIEVWLKDQTGVTGKVAVWKLPANLQSAGSDETQLGTFSVPISLAVAALKLGIAYEWRARTKDPAGLWGPFSAVRALKITSSAPTVVALNVTTVTALSEAKFGATYSDPENDLLGKFHLQMQSISAHTDAAFSNPEAFIWNTGETLPTADEVTSGLISRPYAGQALDVGSYTYRIRAQDDTGVWSAWSYDDWDLTASFEPDPGSTDLTTQVNRSAPVRVALYKMGALRGIGALIGHIDDPIDLGGSGFLNGGGEVYFTLPALHPYCPEVEPHQTHYAVEQWYGDRYRVLFAGIITDFDADGDTMVAYGTDYPGLLQTAVDERYNPDKPDVGADGNGGGGSKYVDKTIDYIIKDQLRYHKALANSPVGFITVGTITALAERATIFSTYAEALPFIVGLIDSHKQGTGRECRFYAKPTSNLYTGWTWTLTDNWGKDRPNIRLEWGGLLNDFRVVALGDFGTRVNAVGQKRGEVKVYRSTQTGGLDEAQWGRRAKTRFYPDIIDQNDLTRRAKEDAAQLAKVGKRIALAVRADMLSPFDGWDLGDSIVVDIERGVVDTTEYGSGGYWTIYGVEWRYYPDGHTDMTLTVIPKKGLTSPDPDLIPSVNPGVAREWQTGYGVPTVYGELPGPTPIDPTPEGRATTPNDWNIWWRYNTQTVPPPADGAFRANSQSTATPATALYIHRDDKDDIDRTIEHARAIAGGRLFIRRDGGTGYWVGRIASDPVMDVGGEYWTYPVQRLSNSLPNLPANNENCLITYLEAGDKTFFPPTDDPVVARWWEDLNTGKVYELDESTGLYRLVLQPSQVGGSAPPVLDTQPPPIPIVKSLVSSHVIEIDGALTVGLAALVGYDTPPSGLIDLLQYSIESTYRTRTDNPDLPDWTISTEWVTQSLDETGVLDTYCVQNRVLAATKYWVRASAIDSSGNRSSWSDPLTALTSEDLEAPPRPSGVIVTPGMGVMAVRWDNIDANDLAYAEVEWRKQPDGNWVVARVGGTLIVITGLTNDVVYDVRLRSVDRSNNTLHDTGTVDINGDPIYETVKATDPDKGWVGGFTGTPTAIPGNALVWDEAIIESIFAGNIDADWITAGTLRVGEGSGRAAAIEVFDSLGNLVGRWSTDGIEVLDPTNPQYKMLITEASLTIFDLTDPGNPIERVRLTPLGIDAASVTFGSARGGHNLVQNSSFELGAFGASTVISSSWDVIADWNATRVIADTNLNSDGNTLFIHQVT